MRKLPVLLLVLLVAAAIPASASQFIRWSFDRITAESTWIVQGRVGQVWSAWDDAHEVIHTYAELNVSRYLSGSGPGLIVVREVGGVVDGYHQEAIGFPELRAGEEVLLFLTQWTDTGHPRIQAHGQGKYLVSRDASGRVLVAEDPVMQGDDRLSSQLLEARSREMSELEHMVRAALQGRQPVTQR